MKKNPIHSTVIRIQNFEGDRHVIPQEDWFEHLRDANCPCNPKLELGNTKRSDIGNTDIWVHHQIKGEKEGCM